MGGKDSVLTCVCGDSVVGVGEDEGVGGGAGLARRWAPVVSVWGDWGAAVVLWGGDVGGSGLACLAGATEHRRGREGGRAPERCRAPKGPRVREEGALPRTGGRRCCCRCWRGLPRCCCCGRRGEVRRSGEAAGGV